MKRIFFLSSSIFVTEALVIFAMVVVVSVAYNCTAQFNYFGKLWLLTFRCSNQEIMLNMSTLIKVCCKIKTTCTVVRRPHNLLVSTPHCHHVYHQICLNI